MPQDRLDRPLDAGEAPSAVLLVGVQEGARRRRLGKPAAHEHLRERAAHAELALQQLDLVRGQAAISKRGLSIGPG